MTAFFVCKYTERGDSVAYSNSKGLIALPTAYDKKDGYTYKKLSYQFIQPNGGISITPKQMQDIDSYRNGNGILKRTVLDNAPTQIEWNTPYLTYEDKCKLIHQIREGYRQGGGVYKARKIRIRYYNDWEDDYDTGTFYMPDVQFQYGGLYHGAPLYLPIRLAAVEY